MTHLDFKKGLIATEKCGADDRLIVRLSKCQDVHILLHLTQGINILFGNPPSTVYPQSYPGVVTIEHTHYFKILRGCSKALQFMRG